MIQILYFNVVVVCFYIRMYLDDHACIIPIKYNKTFYRETIKTLWKTKVLLLK